MPHVPTGRRPGRPPAPPALKARAIELAKASSPEQAAETLKAEGHKVASGRQIREWMKQAGASGSPTTSSAPRPDAPAPVVALAPPPGLSPQALRRWYVEQQIAAVRTALALAESKVNAGDSSALSRIGPLNTQLREWLADLAELEPDTPADPAEEDRKWRAAGEEVMRKIESGVSAVEERQRRERAATGVAG